jgi:hypothetical protein
MQVVDANGNMFGYDHLEIIGADGKPKTTGGGGGPYVPYTGATGNVDLGEYELKAGQLELDQTPTGTAGVAVMRWNDQDGTVDLGLKGGNVTLQVGQEEVIRVVNKAGVNLLEANYQCVRVRTQAEGGAQGQRLAVKLAQANNKANHTGILGLVTETINNNQEGFITTFGEVRKINTTGSIQGETWLDGDVLWLSETTAGQLTNIEPNTHPVQIGYVIYAHANNGKIFVSVSEGVDQLNELHDVAITSVANNDILQYDSATSLWKNESLSNAGIQPTLVSGTDIKTINSTTLLTSGNMNLVAGLSGNSPINTSILTGGIGSISIDQANSTTNGYLSSSNWNTFNGKQNALVSGTNIKTINGSSVLGSGDLIVGGSGGGVHFNTKPISGQYFSGQLVNAGGGASQATSANRMTFIPIIPKTTFTASNFAINVVNTTAGSLCKILIYSDLNGYPSTKLYQSTDLDCSTGGVKTATASSFVFNANTIYWVGTISNQAGATFTGFGSSSVLPLGVSTPGSTMNYFVLNNSFNFLVPPAGPISPTAFSLANNGHIGVFIQAL